jgi:hypothetical protein
VSEVVAFGMEARLFVLDGAVVTTSQYADKGDLAIHDLDGHEHASQLNGFARDVLAAYADTLPSATVLDIGMILHPVTGVLTPAVIEANAAWASGHYACDPDRVLDVVLRAAFSRDGLTGRDAPFVRPVREVER